MNATELIKQPLRPNASSWEVSRARSALRVGAGALVLFVGADHYYEYSADHYSVVPTIGTLFLLNFIAATGCGALLLAPVERIWRGHGRTTVSLAAFAGFGLGATSLIALLVSEQTPLFGFMELNYRPAILVALVSEAAATTLCALLLVLDLRARQPRGRLAVAAEPTGRSPGEHAEGSLPSEVA